MAELSVATCQFPVSSQIDANLGWIRKQMRLAASRGARVAHFCEGALSGYAGTDFDSFEDFDWDHLADATAQVADLAGRLGLWLVVGSAHRLSAPHRPHNSLYVIDDSGRLIERYDKRFCSGDTEGTTGDLSHYSPGDHSSVWNIDGVCCGALICYDYRYPELYRAYKSLGVTWCSIPSTPPTSPPKPSQPSARRSAPNCTDSTGRPRTPIRGSPCRRR